MTAYPELREALAPAYREISDRQVEALFEAHDLDAAELERLTESWGQIGQALQGALPAIGGAVQQYGGPVASGALAGAGTGAAFGPWGALIGALGGGVLGGIQAQPGAGAPRPPLPTMPPSSPGPAGAPFIPPSGPPSGLGGSPAAGQLLSLLARPEIVQALTAMLLGRAGTPAIGVGGSSVAPAAVANLVGVLGQQAATEATAWSFAPRATYWAGDREDETAPESRAAETFEAFLAAARDSAAEQARPPMISFEAVRQTGYTFGVPPEADPEFV